MHMITDDLQEVLQCSLQPIFGDTDASMIEQLPESSHEFLWATIACAGGWSGSISTGCDPALLTHASAQMFGLGEDQVSAADRQDVAAELVNIVAGNVLPLLGEGVTISTPQRLEAEAFDPADTVSVAIAGRWVTLMLRPAGDNE